jgi:hypothetical protein
MDGEPNSTSGPNGDRNGQQTTVLFRLANWQLRRRSGTHHGRKIRTGIIVGVVVALMGAGGAFAYFTASGSGTGQAQAATVTNLSIAAVATPSISHTLYPGSTGDVVLTISNPNVFPVTITAVTLPSATTFAAGFTNSNLTGAIAGCSATTSQVAWNFASNTGSHPLTSALTVGASGTLTVTMTNDAAMGTTAPAACEGTFFQMPPIPSVTATSSTNTATISPTTDSWTS